MKKPSEEKFNSLVKKYFNSPYPILSIYFGFAGKKTPDRKVVLSLFHSLIHQNLSDEEAKIFRSDVDKIEEYLSDEFDSRGARSVVFFTAGKNLWRVFPFEFYLPPLCVVSYSLYVKPLIDAFDSYKKYIVLLIDRGKARLFSVYLGEVQEYAEVFDGIVPQNVRANERDFYGRSDKIFRHIQDHLHRHVVIVANALSEFIKKNGGNFLLIGGHKELLPMIIKELPISVQKMVVAEFVTAVNIPLQKVLLQSKAVAEKIEQNEEESRLESALA